MLKRCQVLLTEWLLEYTDFITEAYDMSFSESVRILMSLGAIQSIAELCPELKPKFSLKKMYKELKKIQKGDLKEDVFHRNVSQVYFEARKAIELRLSQAKKKGKTTV